MNPINYYGNDFSEQRYDELAASAIAQTLLKKETALFKSKWFDYRHLHPTQATYLYAWHFRNESRKLYCKIKNVDSGLFFEPFAITVAAENQQILDTFRRDNKLTKTTGYYLDHPDRRALQSKIAKFNDSVNDVMLGKEAAPLWKGRQLADKIGMPYNTFINLIIGSLMGDYRHGSIDAHTHMPRPKQLYSKMVEEWVTEQWQELLKHTIVEPQIAHLGDANPKHVQIRKDIEKWVCARILERRYPEFSLANCLFAKKLITEHYALQCFSSELLKKAQRIHSEW